MDNQSLFLAKGQFSSNKVLSEKENILSSKHGVLTPTSSFFFSTEYKMARNVSDMGRYFTLQCSYRIPPFYT